MNEEIRQSPRSNIGWGLFSAAMGLFIVAGALGLFGLDLHPTDETPPWVGVFAGGIFFAGGLAIILPALTALSALPDGSFTSDAPLWARFAQLALGLAITGGFAAIGLWIGFGPGPRHFSMTGTFGSDHVNETIGRVIFGAGGVLVSLMFILFAITGARRLMNRGKS